MLRIPSDFSHIPTVEPTDSYDKCSEHTWVEVVEQNTKLLTALNVVHEMLVRFLPLIRVGVGNVNQIRTVWKDKTRIIIVLCKHLSESGDALAGKGRAIPPALVLEEQSKCLAYNRQRY